MKTSSQQMTDRLYVWYSVVSTSTSQRSHSLCTLLVPVIQSVCQPRELMPQDTKAKESYCLNIPKMTAVLKMFSGSEKINAIFNLSFMSDFPFHRSGCYQ